MIVLGIDTALAACSAALVHDDRLLARRFEPMTRGHAERLFPMLGEVCAEAGLGLKDVDRIAVTTGPGSFTGTRAGLAAARGIALAARCPGVGVTTLQAIAAAAEEVPASAIIGVLVDARRGGFYGQLFTAGGAGLTDPFAATAEVAALRFAEAGPDDQPLLLIGTGAKPALEAFRSWPGGVSLAQGNSLPDAAVVARLGAGLEPRESPPAPLYLRPPDAVPAAPGAVVR
ncbi:MAG: tRNA (adenosine(37)-N6)-threonylcarbamoyltransferase complex dimerization subunit type 1 TsaB [Alphaproteobacteria bacterium]